MKLLTITMTLAILAASATSPALADSYRHQSRMSAAPAAQGYASDPAYEAYAAADSFAAESAENGTAGAPAVISYGRYAGWDPDPAIRFQLLRDPPGLSQ